MLYFVYRLSEDGSKDRLHITNDRDVAERCKAYQETLLEVPVMIETEETSPYGEPGLA